MTEDAFSVSEALIDRAGRAASNRDIDALAAIMPQIASSLVRFHILVGDPAQLSPCERAAIFHQSSIVIAKLRTIIQLTIENMSTLSAEFNEKIKCLLLQRSRS
ncbi:hypothetical protein [Bosea thiooxidans]|uniref:hypothetical protein n=1 Tax=Bosea thiooxidans TaxID=53254 RepID=UPI00111797E1|nr:hypothetical protein [Bosea thiooxidans]